MRARRRRPAAQATYRNDDYARIQPTSAFAIASGIRLTAQGSFLGRVYDLTNLFQLVGQEVVRRPSTPTQISYLDLITCPQFAAMSRSDALRAIRNTVQTWSDVPFEWINQGELDRWALHQLDLISSYCTLPLRPQSDPPYQGPPLPPSADYMIGIDGGYNIPIPEGTTANLPTYPTYDMGTRYPFPEYQDVKDVAPPPSMTMEEAKSGGYQWLCWRNGVELSEEDKELIAKIMAETGESFDVVYARLMAERGAGRPFLRTKKALAAAAVAGLILAKLR